MSSEPNRASAAQQTLDILYDLSQLLNTQLDREQLATCVSMIESGVNPEALAAAVKELRRKTDLDARNDKRSGQSESKTIR